MPARNTGKKVIFRIKKELLYYLDILSLGIKIMGSTALGRLKSMLKDEAVTSRKWETTQFKRCYETVGRPIKVTISKSTTVFAVRNACWDIAIRIAQGLTTYVWSLFDEKGLQGLQTQTTIEPQFA